MDLDFKSDYELNLIRETANTILEARRKESVNSYYKFNYGDKVNINSYVGALVPATVVCCYTSTKFDHPADSHKRYVVICDYEGGRTLEEITKCRIIDNVSENELEIR